MPRIASDNVPAVEGEILGGNERFRCPCAGRRGRVRYRGGGCWGVRRCHNDLSLGKLVDMPPPRPPKSKTGSHDSGSNVDVMEVSNGPVIS